MAIGPVELLVVRFPENQFRGEIVRALDKLVNKGTIRIIDVLFVEKDAQGMTKVIELNDLEDEIYHTFDPIVSDVRGLLTEEDVIQLTRMIENNSSSAIMLFENVWVTQFREEVINTNGEIVLFERIPRQVIDEIQAERKKQQTDPYPYD